MPAYAYEIEESGRDEFILDREAVAAETDPETLSEWVRGLENKADILSMQIEAFREDPKEDDESLRWFNRVCMAKAANAIGLTRLRQRRIQLGLIANPMAREMDALKEKLLAAKARIAALENGEKTAP